MADRLRLDIDGGKYTIVQPEDGQSYALRYGEPWICPLQAGSNMILAMAYELQDAREKLAAAGLA